MKPAQDRTLDHGYIMHLLISAGYDTIATYKIVDLYRTVLMTFLFSFPHSLLFQFLSVYTKYTTKVEFPDIIFHLIIVIPKVGDFYAKSRLRLLL